MTETDRLQRRPSLLTLTDLQRVGFLTAQQVQDMQPLADSTAIAITPHIADLMIGQDANDPVVRQFLPQTAEMTILPEERSDPIGDDAHSPVHGLVHRYPDRVLIKPIMVCPVYCRFCFRREKVGDAGATLGAAELDACFDYVAQRPEIREIILTGGDPLMLTAARLADLRQRAAAVPHVDILRFHSRVPIADPCRVTDRLVSALVDGAGPLAWVSVHVNHSRELTPQAEIALARLRKGGIPLVSQSVLLRGVNDRVEDLEQLWRSLLRLGVKPYYLHHPDLAAGTSHFRLTIAEGQALVQALRGRLSGLGQVQYVLDIPGGAGKSPLPNSWWDDKTKTIRNWQGHAFSYDP